MKKLKPNNKLILPLIITFIIYLICYFLPKFVVSEDSLHILYLPIDDKIVFYSPAIIIYILSFFIWANAGLVVVHQETKLGYRLFSIIIIGSIIGCLIFIFYPTGVIRPEIVGNSIFDSICRLIYNCDSIANACPSFHCFLSTLTIYIFLKSKGISKISVVINIIISIMIYISTLLTKQHLFFDVPCGILLGIVSIILSKIIKLDFLFDKTNQLLIKK